MDKWRCSGVITHLLIRKLQNKFRRTAPLFVPGCARRKLSGSGRGEEPEPQQVSAAEAAERDGQSAVMEAVAGTKESQTSREIK